MSQYELPDFNPIDPDETRFHTYHANQVNVPFHIVDAQVLCTKALSERVTLVDAAMPESGFGVRLTASYGNGLDGENMPARLFDGAINLEKTAAGLSRFHHHFNGARYRIGDLGTTVDTNTPTYRWMRHPEVTSLSMAIECQTEADKLLVTNHARAPYARYPEIRNNNMLWEDMYRVLDPPSTDMNFERYGGEVGQLVAYMQGLVMAAEVAHNIGSFDTLTPFGMDDLVLTPEGPLYRNPDTKQFVHSLERQQITVTEELDTPAVTSEEIPAASLTAPIRPESKRRTPSPNPAWETPKTTFDDLYGIEDIQDELTGLIAWFKHPEKAARWRAARPNGILLHGPGGTGKTSIVHALADAIGAHVRPVEPNQVYRSFIGDAEKAFKAIWDEVRRAKTPLVVFFDEFEGVIATTTDTRGASRTTNAIAGMFKTEVDAIKSTNPNVVFAAATNHLDAIDEALVRSGRFDIKLQVGMPNDASRRAIIAGILGAEQWHDFNDADAFQRFDFALMEDHCLSALATATDGMTGADVRNIVNSALLRKMQADMRGEDITAISQRDLLVEISRYQKR